MMLETVVGIVGIVVTIISIIVTVISIIQTEKKHKRQKSNRRSPKKRLLFDNHLQLRRTVIGSTSLHLYSKSTVLFCQSFYISPFYASGFSKIILPFSITSRTLLSESRISSSNSLGSWILPALSKIANSS